STKPWEMLEASYLPISLNSAQIGPSPIDHFLRCVTPGSQILVRPLHYRYIDIGCQICIDAKLLQVVCNTISQLSRILDISRLIHFQSTWTMAKDIRDTLHKSPLLVRED